jgi:hypothetical protein
MRCVIGAVSVDGGADARHGWMKSESVLPAVADRQRYI